MRYTRKLERQIRAASATSAAAAAEQQPWDFQEEEEDEEEEEEDDYEAERSGGYEGRERSRSPMPPAAQVRLTSTPKIRPSCAPYLHVL